MKFWLILVIYTFSQAALAEELTGSFTETGSDTQYTVHIQNDLGHVYTGTASELVDGRLHLNVGDGTGDHYTGIATLDADNDGYDIHLSNPQTGQFHTGNVDVNEF